MFFSYLYVLFDRKDFIADKQLGLFRQGHFKLEVMIIVVFSLLQTKQIKEAVIFLLKSIYEFSILELFYYSTNWGIILAIHMIITHAFDFVRRHLVFCNLPFIRELELVAGWNAIIVAWHATVLERQ